MAMQRRFYLRNAKFGKIWSIAEKWYGTHDHLKKHKFYAGEALLYFICKKCAPLSDSIKKMLINKKKRMKFECATAGTQASQPATE